MRVNYNCSYLKQGEECWKPTLGPHSEDEKSVNLGKAAHITAASKGGPRYDPTLSKAERKSIRNGIWMCGLHAELVDKDEGPYPTPLLKDWKKLAEERARIEAFTSGNGNTERPILELSDEDKEFFASLVLPPEETTENILTRMLESASTNIQTYTNSTDWPEHTIPLNLTLEEESQNLDITLEGLKQGVDVSGVINLISSPGTGKTTTMIQLSEVIINSGESVAAYIPLNLWCGHKKAWFEYLIGLNAFRSFKIDHFMKLAYEGRLVLLLDGWNELDSDTRLFASREITRLRLEFPQLNMVIGSRKQALPTSDGVTVKIESLNDEQQLDIARQIRGADGEKILDQAWRNPYLRELVSIPFYLTALLSGTSGTSLPQTKEEILKGFVDKHEADPEKAEILRKELFGCHKCMLEGLAVEGIKNSTSSLLEKDARPIVVATLNKLKSDGQISGDIQPALVLDTLVNTHSLVRGGENISFQHHQFQEWYASFKVEELMLSAASGNNECHKELKYDVLNWISWEEAVLFACERLSKNDVNGAKVVSAAILDATAIDPLLAAEMIYRSSPEIWQHIGDEILGLVKIWHAKGKIDRAVNFMITSGRSEFSEYIWPLISSANNQVYLKALRIAKQFRPKVLGENVKKRLSELPDEIRGHVVGEIGQRSGFDGMELAASIAKNDQNADVIFEIIQDLQFRRADRHVKDILSSASEEVWEIIATRSYPEELICPEQAERLTAIRNKLFEKKTDKVEIIYYLIRHQNEEDSTEERIVKIVASEDFSMKDDRSRSIIWEIYEKLPESAARALLERLNRGLEVPYKSEEILQRIESIDSGSLVDKVLNNDGPEYTLKVISTVVGPDTIESVLDKLLKLNDEFKASDERAEQSKIDEYGRLRDIVLTSRESSFIPALLRKSKTSSLNQIEMMLELFSIHGKDHKYHQIVLTPETEKELLNIFKVWGELLLSPDANRHQRAYLAKAIGRQGFSDFLPMLKEFLEQDFVEREKEQNDFKKTGRRPSNGSACNKSLYGQAFASIGSPEAIQMMFEYLPDVRFGFEASCVLFQIWRRDNPSGNDDRFSTWPDFSEVKSKRKYLSENPDEPLDTCAFAEAIFDTINKIITSDCTDEQQKHAIAIAKVALGMPHGRKNKEVDMLLNLPQQYSLKINLLSAFAMTGEVISSEFLKGGFNELLELGKEQPWRIEENRGEVMKWLALFPFSDKPLAIFDIIASIPSSYRYPHQLRSLLNSLGKSSHEDALEVLKKLLEPYPNMIKEYEWLEAVLKLETEDSASFILELICEGKLKKSNGMLDRYRLSKQLAYLIDITPLLKEKVLAKYKETPPSLEKSVLEATLIEIVDEDIFLDLIYSLASNKQPYDGRLAAATEKLAIGQRPVDDWPGAFERFSTPLTELRKKLFDIHSQSDDLVSSLAESCLIKIEKLRDENGRISSEPRHPNIDSGKPWPKEAKKVS